MRAKMTVALFALSALFLAVSGPAWGGSRTQELPNGDDGYVDTNNTHLTICDREADGNTAYSKAYSIAGNFFRVYDQDGSSGSCWFTPVPSRVSSHNTCEDINNWPDDCSDQGWSYRSHTWPRRPPADVEGSWVGAARG